MIIEEFWQLVVLMGIPSSITGLGIWWLQRTLIKRDKKQEEVHSCITKYQLILLKSVNASLILGEVTAKAVRDGTTNGELSKALEHADKIKREQLDFVESYSISNLHP